MADADLQDKCQTLLEQAADKLKDTLGEEFHFTLFIYTEVSEDEIGTACVTTLPAPMMNTLLLDYLTDHTEDLEDDEDDDTGSMTEACLPPGQTLN